MALRLEPGCSLALTGAGGKSGILFALGQQLPGQVIASTSTHLAEEQAAYADVHLVIESPADVQRYFSGYLPKLTLITGRTTDTGRLSAPPMAVLEALHEQAIQRGWSVLIEADGARRLPLKAPAEHEPAVPAFSRHVLHVAGLSGLGKPLDEQAALRTELFSALSGLPLGAPVSPEALERVLAHPQGGLKGAQAGQAISLALTQANSDTLLSTAGKMARHMIQVYDRVLIVRGGPQPETLSVAAVVEPVAGVLLAAGGATRMGSPKQLLPWKGRPMVWWVAQAALQAGLDPLIVVTGAAAESVRSALDGLNVRFVHNPGWQEGIASSIRAGLLGLPDRIGACFFLPADMPRLPSAILEAMQAIHTLERPAMIAPEIEGRRASPSLFDRSTFPALLTLQGDQGGRVLNKQFRLRSMPWIQAADLIDADTPEDYRRLLEGE